MWIVANTAQERKITSVNSWKRKALVHNLSFQETQGQTAKDGQSK